jgi:hypothetical protein
VVLGRVSCRRPEAFSEIIRTLDERTSAPADMLS